MTDCVVDFIAETNQPLSLVDNSSFIKMLSKFDNKYKLPCRQTVTNKYLKEKVENLIASIGEEISIAEFVSITLDCWSSVSRNPYLGMNINAVLYNNINYYFNRINCTFCSSIIVINRRK